MKPRVLFTLKAGALVAIGAAAGVALGGKISLPTNISFATLITPACAGGDRGRGDRGDRGGDCGRGDRGGHDRGNDRGDHGRGDHDRGDRGDHDRGHDKGDRGGDHDKGHDRGHDKGEKGSPAEHSANGTDTCGKNGYNEERCKRVVAEKKLAVRIIQTRKPQSPQGPKPRADDCVPVEQVMQACAVFQIVRRPDGSINQSCIVPLQ